MYTMLSKKIFSYNYHNYYYFLILLLLTVPYVNNETRE